MTDKVAIGKIYTAIPKIMADIQAISKDQKNTAQNFKYRGIDDIYNGVQKIMAKHGVFSAPSILERSRTPIQTKSGTTAVHSLTQFRYDFYADDGSFVPVFVDGEAIDTGDKVTAKCAAIAHKYALIQLFCIPTAESIDPDQDSHEVRSEPVKKEPKPERGDEGTPSLYPVFNKTLAEDVVWASNICQYHQIPQEQFQAIIDWLDKKPRTLLTTAIQRKKEAANAQT